MRAGLLACLVLTFPAMAEDRGAKGGVDARTGEAIKAAIARGSAWLKSQLVRELAQPPLSIEHKPMDGKPLAVLFPAGRAALLGLALLESGVPPSDPVVRKAWEKLRSSPPSATYEAGIGLMFAEAFLRRARGGKQDPKDLAWVRKAADTLASGCYGGAWTYVCPGGDGYPIGEDPKRPYAIGGEGEGGEDGGLEALVAQSRARPHPGDLDHSNTQFAVLGLKAASLCGVRVRNARLMWRTVVQHFLDAQEREGPEVDLALTREEGRLKLEDYTLEEEPARPRARGWGYMDGTPAYGSMSAAGLTALIVAQSEVQDLGDGERRRIRLSVRDALAWFQRHWAVDRNPLAPEWIRQSHYYHLYGLERVGVLTSVRALVGHAWYKEGAEVLLKAQKPSGGWPGDGAGIPEDEAIRTAYALLFLARATRSEYAAPPG